MGYRHLMRRVTEAAKLVIKLRPHGAFIAGDGFNIDQPAGQLDGIHARDRIAFTFSHQHSAISIQPSAISIQPSDKSNSPQRAQRAQGNAKTKVPEFLCVLRVLCGSLPNSIFYRYGASSR